MKPSTVFLPLSPLHVRRAREPMLGIAGAAAQHRKHVFDLARHYTKRVTAIAAAVAQARADFSDIGSGIAAACGPSLRSLYWLARYSAFRIAPIILAGIGGAASFAGPSKTTIGQLVVVLVVQGLRFPQSRQVLFNSRAGEEGRVRRDPLRPHQTRRRRDTHPASPPPDPPLAVLGLDGETICASSPTPCAPLSRAERAYWWSKPAPS